MPTVLVVDDDDDNRELLAAILRGLAYDVITARDAQTAAHIVAGRRVDAILLDVRLPAVSGVELCRQLRRRPATATLPIVLVSADADADHIAAGLAAGADDYLVKPYTRTDVVGSLDALLAVPVGAAASTALSPGMYAALAVRPVAPLTASAQPAPVPAFTA